MLSRGKGAFIKTVAFVPMKMNNERLPGKNSMLLGGKVPLFSLILESLKKVKQIDEIFVFCSEPYIEGLPSSVTYLRRDATLDLPEVSIIDVMYSFAEQVNADIYVLAHATAPFLKAASIEKVVKALQIGDFDSALTVLASREFIWSNGKPQNYDLTNVPRTQDLIPLWIETTGIYAYTQSTIKKRRRIGDNPCLVEVSKVEAIDINDREDWEIADAIYRQRLG